MKYPRYWVNGLPYFNEETDDREEALARAATLKAQGYDVEIEDRRTGATIFSYLAPDL